MTEGFQTCRLIGLSTRSQISRDVIPGFDIEVLRPFASGFKIFEFLIVSLKANKIRTADSVRGVKGI